MLTSSLMSLDALLCLIALVGLVLLGFGVKGRRVGDEPRCRKCGYNLTGATAQVCSECGKTIDAQGVVFGVRRRRKLAILLGVLCVLPISGRWSVKGYQYAQTVNRYQFYPFSWVLADSGGGEAEALDEVDRRLRSGRLNATQSAQLAIAALKKQGATTADGQTQQWVDMLEFLYQAGDLSGDQTTTYFAQMRTYALKVRDQVCEGEGIPFRISYAGRGPSFAIRGDVGDGRWTDVSVESGRVLLRRIDGVDVRGPTYAVEAYIVSSDMGPTVGRTGSCESVLRSPTAPPGRYELTLDLEEKVNPQGVLGPVREGPRVSTRNVKVTQQIEVLSFDECHIVEVVDDPTLAQGVRDALRVGPLEIPPTDSHQGDVFVRLSVLAGGRSGVLLPIDVAFDVSVRVNGNEWPLDSVTLKAGKGDWIGLNGHISTYDVGSVGVILRANPLVAREALDITEIWDGELEFDGVAVERSQY